MAIAQIYNPNNKITITESAINHFKTVINENNAVGVRLGLTGGGCAGFEYKWDMLYNKDVAEDDYVEESDDLLFVIDNMSFEYLENSNIDYISKGIQGNEIVIQSPRAVSSCGCGESITFK